MHKIAVIAGDGVGPEVIGETIKVGELLAKKFKLNIEFERFPFGADYYLDTGITISGTVFEEWPKKYTAVLLGALGDPRIKSDLHAKDILMGLRKKLNLYVNLRPVKLIDIRYCPLKQVTDEKQVDFTVFRENTEDIYSQVGGSLKKGTDEEVAIENAVYTYNGVKRIVEAAFQYACRTKKTSVIMGDKSNVMRHIGGLWQRLFSEIGEKFPEIKKAHIYIDALCMQVIRDPGQFQVIVTSNMFGDILTDISAQIQGGMGLAASANFNPTDEKFLGLYEPVHGSAPDIAGQNISNPIASILSFQLLLQRMGFHHQAEVLFGAVKKTMAGENITPDLGGNCSTTGVGDCICSHIEEAE